MNFQEDTYIKFGTALPALEEEDVESRKPIKVEDQIAVDENGRRRFHGAFTGGFSAGFWNTVGSLEGWKPQEFKSSRQEKATRKRQCVDDFMDDEDKGEFGIAPQRVQARDDYKQQDSLGSKRTKIAKVSGPIPGVPVLQTLLQPAKDNIATRLLKQMGWREGQGIGARQTRNEKKRAQERNQKELYLMEKYGCDLGDRPSTSSAVAMEEGSDSEDEEITFAPDDFDPFLASVKENTFGFGYSGLDRNPVLGKRFNLFQPLEIVDKNNKKLSISGQAFGVGAFEVDDEDIYAKEDMSRYDFSLEDKKNKGAGRKKEMLMIQQGALEGFEAPQETEKGRHRCKVYRITLPKDFQPRNWAERRSRFDRMPEDKERELSSQNSYKLKGLGRHDLNPDQRSALLNEAGPSKVAEQAPLPTPQVAGVQETPRNKFLDMINKKYQSFEKSSEVINETVDQEAKRALQEAKKKTEGMPVISTSNSKTFKPFQQDLQKQKRYEQFCEIPLGGDKEMTQFLATIQPVELSEWDREMEKKEFIQARKLFRPLDGLMMNRFVTETELNAERAKDQASVTDDGASKKKDVQMRRVKAMWKPDPLLCKRFNVPEPFGGAIPEDKEKNKKKTKFSVFDYLEVSVNSKEAFVTPVVRPSEKAQLLKEDRKADLVINPAQEQAAPSGSRLSTKEMFEMELQRSQQESTASTKDADVIIPVAPVPTKPRERPKTELEQKSIELKDTHPAEKKDLFKAIFDDSSDEEENAEDTNSVPAPQKPDITELLKKSATEMNVLRNNSPPRGIFANIFKKPATSEEPKKVEDVKIEEVAETKAVDERRPADPPKIVFKRKEERETIRSKNSNDDGDVDEDMCFGPRPPPKAPLPPAGSSKESLFDVFPKKDTTADDLDRKLAKALKGKDLKIVEEWVEKDSVSSSSSKKKKSKKHKKEKKHKKDKR